LANLLSRIDKVAEERSGYTAADHQSMALGSDSRGLAGRDMSSDQRALLRDLIATYTARAPEPVAESLQRHYAQDMNLDLVRFGWAGDIGPGQPHYYRLTGPRLLVEYDNTQRAANHAHSVWRDPSGDFGLDPLDTHRATLH
jgi:hypothetical protein